MTFIQATAAIGSRAPELLSADNARPERHIVVETLRRAAPLLGLKPTVLATLEAMLSCLAPKRGHNMVFASNLTLCTRRNGVSDRTLRRHVALLQEAGLLQRRDSANGKRFSRHDPAAKQTLHFGFDLSPLFRRLGEIAALAVQAQSLAEQIGYLKTKIRAQLRPLLQADPTDARALCVLRQLRNKQSLAELLALSETLPETAPEAVDNRDTSAATARQTSASDGQNVRHHQKSNKEHTEKENRPSDATAAGEDLTLAELVEACPDAASFSARAMAHFGDVVAHAETLAPMVGIDRASYAQAVRSIGLLPSAITIWAIVQVHDRIRNAGAYFRALTSGSKRRDFDPVRLIRRLGNCPRTTAPGGFAPC